MQQTVQITLRMPPGLHDRVMQVAEAERISQREAYIRILSEGLDLTPDEVLDILAPRKVRGPRLVQSAGNN